MVRESQDTQRPGTPRPRSGADASRHSRGASDGSSINSSKGSVFSKVMSSFRHKHHDDKQKADGQAKQQQEDGDWISNYKITHRPDRPRVDKRTVRERTSTEYMAELLRIQARSQQHYEVNHPGGRSMDKRLTPPSSPPLLPPQPLHQMAEMLPAATADSGYSPRSPRMGSPSPLTHSPSTTFTRHQRSPSGDQYPTTTTRGHQRMPSEPMSPDAMTIQVYRGSLIDRSASCPQPAEHNHNQVQLLPQKTYNPNESSYAKRTIAMRDSGYAGRKGSSSSASTSTTDSHSVHRKAPSTNLHSTATAMAPAVTTFSNQPLTSSPTSYTSPAFTFAPPPQRAVRSLSPRNNNNILPANLPAISPKTCVMPGCRAPLLSALDCEQNVCAPCRKEYRQSTFDAGMSIARPPPPPPLSARAPLTSNLETLRALVGTAGLDGTFDMDTRKYNNGSNGNGNGNGNGYEKGGDNTRVTAVERGPLAPLVNKSTSNFQSSVAFKLQPAPPGRKRRQRVQQKAGSSGSVSGSGSTTRPPQPPVSAWSDSTPGSQTTSYSHIYSSGSGIGGSGSQHVAYQDRRLYRASRKISDSLPKQPSPVEEKEEAEAEKGAQYGFYLTESPRSSTIIRNNDNENSRNSSDSWTSASPPKSLDSKNSSDASLSPLSEPLESPALHISPLRPTRYVPPSSEKQQKRSHSDGSAAVPSSHRESAHVQPLRLAPAAPITRSSNKAGTSSHTIPAGSIRVLPHLPPPPSPLPSPPPAGRRPGRDTLLYQAIDDIIDSYAGVADDEFRASGVERWRADATASIYEDPEDVEMRRKGFF